MAERSLCLPLTSCPERLDQLILEVPPSLIFWDFVALNCAHHWCKVSVVIYALLNIESKIGSGSGDQADLCTVFRITPEIPGGVSFSSHMCFPYIP